MPTEQFRPEYHFTPAQNWQNDPNGLFYYGGQYHLYFQHNPFGDQWGNMSWGHAVSHDLLTWHELPVAIPSGDTDWIFSGSLVVDENNTSGFGNGLDGQPPFVAIYTDANKLTPEQEQAIAYSHDGGLTFTKYEGNPVLDIADPEFRDPKVFWDDDAGHWTMVVARPLVRQVEFYSSTDLKSWDYLSSFGPQGATGGIWEVPDLIELPVDGDPNNTKHVLIVNLNPGSPYGGSGVQYFIGEWDGKTFTAENSPGLGGVPGDVFEDFEGTTYGTGWTTTGTAFGSGPAQGNLPGQTYVVLYEGEGLVNSFQNENASTGTLTSPTFTISSDYINLLVGGGEHAFTAGSDDATAVNLVVNGEVVRTATGTDSDALDWTAWNVSEFAGEEAQIRIVDQNTGDWGHILVDQISFSDELLRRGGAKFGRTGELGRLWVGLLRGHLLQQSPGRSEDLDRLDEQLGLHSRLANRPVAQRPEPAARHVAGYGRRRGTLGSDPDRAGSGSPLRLRLSCGERQSFERNAGTRRSGRAGASP
jgi:hypothetical protein